MSIVFVILSSLLFGIHPSIQNMAMLKGADVTSVLFSGSLVAVIGSFLLCILNKSDLKASKKELFYFFLAGLMIFVTDLFLPLAYTKMPVGLVTAIHFTYPTIVCLLGVLLFHEAFSIKRLLAIVLSIAGLILLNQGDVSYDLSGTFYALVSAVSYACCLSIVDHSLIQNADPNTKSFYIFLTATVLTLLLNGGVLPSSFTNAEPLPYLILAGVMLLLGNLFLIKGIAGLGSTVAAFISTLEPITSVLFSNLLYHYELPLLTVIGSFLIILSLIPIIHEKVG
ncbi:MAG: EamA family transporter [Erysipelotrichaceae bacterium]|nr:EamA family transporter [Erysipelotrichaceae bacterium]